MLQEQLVGRLCSVPGLVAAYLFGSRATGRATESSDVDVAIWLTDRPTTFDAYPFELATDLERAVGAKVDLVVLNGADSDV